MRFIKNLHIQAFIFVLGLNLFFRVLLNWPLGLSISTPDSISYRPSPPGPQTFPYEGQVALEKLSQIDFFGNSLRPWPINFLFQVLPNDQMITIFSIFIGVLSWTYLIFSIAKLFKQILLQIISGSLVFIFSLTTFVYSWDKFILSEPIVNSFFIGFIGLLLNKLTREISKTTDVVLYILWLIITISRPIFGLVLIPLLFIKEVKYGRYLFFKVLLVLMSSFYVILINQNSSEKWLDLMGTPREGLSFAHLSAKGFDHSKLFNNFAQENDAPDCLFVPENNSDIWKWARSYKDNCSDGVVWLQNEFTSNYLFYLLNTEIFYKFVLEKSPITMSGVDFRIYYPYQVNKVSNLNNLFTSIFWGNSKIFFVIKLSLFFLFLLFTIFSSKSVVNFGLLSILIFSFFGSLFQTTLMPTDFERLGLPGSFIFNLFPVIFLLLFLENVPQIIRLIRR